MNNLNVEWKAVVGNMNNLEEKFKTLNPDYQGEDKQTDTYFNVPKGRLKLREGNIENSLIYYERENIAGAKSSKFFLYKYSNDKSLKEILTYLHSIKIVVTKLRRIYFIENVKFHFDTIENLGTFIEVEARDINGAYTIEQLQSQCNYYASFFEIENDQYQSLSYSDLLMF